PTAGLADPTYYLATQVVVQHPVTLATAGQNATSATSCYHTPSEHHTPTWAGKRNHGGGIYNNGKAWQTYATSVPCVHLVAAPCPHCQLPKPQFYVPIPGVSTAGNVAFPLYGAPASAPKQNVFVDQGMSGIGFVWVGRRDFGEVSDITL